MLGKFIKSQKFQTVVDAIHVIICIVTILLAVFVFWKPLEHEFCYPFIFLLAAILNFVDVFAKIFSPARRKHSILSIFVQILFGILLVGITFLSGISIWRG
jgi:hypothetical protein